MTCVVNVCVMLFEKLKTRFYYWTIIMEIVKKITMTFNGICFTLSFVYLKKNGIDIKYNTNKTKKSNNGRSSYFINYIS